MASGAWISSCPSVKTRRSGMTRVVVLACRVVMWAARKLAPPAHAEVWREEYLGRLWRWMLDAAAAGTTDSASALVAHTRAAAREALALRFRGRPSTCLALCAALA